MTLYLVYCLKWLQASKQLEYGTPYIFAEIQPFEGQTQKPQILNIEMRN